MPTQNHCRPPTPQPVDREKGRSWHRLGTDVGQQQPAEGYCRHPHNDERQGMPAIWWLVGKSDRNDVIVTMLVGFSISD